MATEPSKTTSPVYDSNPFTLAFRSFERLFTVNKNWAIAIIVIFVIGGILSFAGDTVRVMIQLGRRDMVDQSSYMQRERGNSFKHKMNYVPSEKSRQAIEKDIQEVKNTAARNAPAIIAGVVIIALIVVGAVIVSTAIGTFITGVLSYVAIKSVDGQTVGFSEALQATGSKYWTLLGAQLLAGLKIFGWSLLFIIPGIIATLRYAILPYVIMAEEKMGVGASHDRTKTLVKGRLWEIFGLSFVAGIVPFIGQILGITGYGAAYRQLQATHDNDIERPKIHWLNYLGLILIGVMLAFMLLIGMVILITVMASRSGQ